MNVRTSLMTTAALGLVASASAQAMAVREPALIRGTDKSRAVQATAHGSRTLSGRASRGSKGSKGGPTTPVIYIHVPGATTPATPVVDPNACQDSGDGCTNLEACEYWGENCGSLTAADLATGSQGGAAPSSTPAGVTTGSQSSQ